MVSSIGVALLASISKMARLGALFMGEFSLRNGAQATIVGKMGYQGVAISYK